MWVKGFLGKVGLTKNKSGCESSQGQMKRASDGLVCLSALVLTCKSGQKTWVLATLLP